MKEFTRRMVSENNLSVNDLIWPLFVCDGNNIAEKINSMPGVFRYSIDNILKELEAVAKLPKFKKAAIMLEHGVPVEIELNY